MVLFLSFQPLISCDMTAACAVCRLPMLSESEGKAVLERQWLSQSQIDWLRDFSSIVSALLLSRMLAEAGNQFVMSAGIKTPYDHTGGMFMSKTGSGMVATLTSLEENVRCTELHVQLRSSFLLALTGPVHVPRA